jgi:hypothetical protein
VGPNPTYHGLLKNGTGFKIRAPFKTGIANTFQSQQAHSLNTSKLNSIRMMGQGESRRHMKTFEEDDDDEIENEEQGQQQQGGGSPQLPLITPYGRRASTSRFRVSSSAVTSLVSNQSNSSSSASGSSNDVDSSTNGTDYSSSALSDSSSSGMGGVDEWIERLYQCKALPEGDAIALCNKAKEVLLQEPSVNHIQCPVSVCGDIHGQVGRFGGGVS